MMIFFDVQHVMGLGDFRENVIVRCDACEMREFSEGMDQESFFEDLREAGWTLSAERDVCPECRRHGQNRKRVLKPDTADRWSQCYFRCKNSQQTFRQCEALFVKENGYWPPHNLSYMPRHAKDWMRKVREVPNDDLIFLEAKQQTVHTPTEIQGVLF